VQGGQLLDRLGCRLAHHQYQAVGAAGGQPVEPLPVAGGAVLGGGEDDLRARLPGLRLGAAQHLHDPGGVEGGQHHVHEADAPERPGLAPLVAAVGHHLLDPQSGGLGDVGAAVEDLGDRRNRHSGLFGDLRDRHAAADPVQESSRVRA
jgi:hypothetical protein